MEQSFIRHPSNFFANPYLWPFRAGAQLENGADVNDFARTILFALLLFLYATEQGMWKWVFFAFAGWLALQYLFRKYDLWRTGGQSALKMYGIEGKTYWDLPDAEPRPGVEKTDSVNPPALLDEVNNPYGNPSYTTYDLAVRSAPPNVTVMEEGDNMFDNLTKPVGENRMGWFMNTVPDPTLMGFLPQM
jgi:hypothetical protein